MYLLQSGQLLSALKQQGLRVFALELSSFSPLPYAVVNTEVLSPFCDWQSHDICCRCQSKVMHATGCMIDCFKPFPHPRKCACLKSEPWNAGCQPVTAYAPQSPAANKRSCGYSASEQHSAHTLP